jgi:hypothetical protein
MHFEDYCRENWKKERKKNKTSRLIALGQDFYWVKFFLRALLNRATRQVDGGFTHTHTQYQYQYGSIQIPIIMSWV